MQELTVTDDCTGLYNARHLNQVLEGEIYRSSRFGHEFSLVFMDLDRFKNVNDAYGHLVGSKVLGRIGELIQGHLRVIDSAQVALDQLADPPQDLRAYQVPVGIIDVFEPIEVHEDEGELVPEARGAVDFPLEHLIEMPGVVEPRAVVGYCKLLHAPEVPDVFERNGGIIGHKGQSDEFFFGEAVIGPAVRQLDNTQDRIASFDGHTQDRPDICGTVWGRLVKARVFPEVFNQQRLAALGRPPGRAFSQP